MKWWNMLRRAIFGPPDHPAPASVTLLDEIGLFFRQTAARGWVDPDEFIRIWDQSPRLIEVLILYIPEVRDSHPTDERRKRFLWKLARDEKLTATMLGDALGDDHGTALRDLKRVFRSD